MDARFAWIPRSLLLHRTNIGRLIACKSVLQPYPILFTHVGRPAPQASSVLVVKHVHHDCARPTINTFNTTLRPSCCYMERNKSPSPQKRSAEKIEYYWFWFFNIFSPILLNLFRLISARCDALFFRGFPSHPTISLFCSCRRRRRLIIERVPSDCVFPSVPIIIFLFRATLGRVLFSSPFFLVTQ